jgi:hypothetical protein
MLIFRTLIENAALSKESLKRFSQKINVEVKKPNSKSGSYCKVEALSSRIKMEKPEEVFNNLRKAISLIKLNSKI